MFYYVSDGNNSLYTINRVTGVTTLIGSTGRSDIEAIAYYPIPTSRTLYAADAGDFGTLNRTTGAFTLIGEIDGGGTANGAAGPKTLNDVDGLMLGAQSLIMWAVERKSPGADLLFQINLTTGRFVPNAFGTGIDYLEIKGDGIDVDVDDIAIDPITRQIYGVSNNGGVNDILFRVNRATGEFEFVAHLSENDIEGLAFSNDGRLYGSDGGAENRLGEINITTGVFSNFHTFTGSDVEALAALVADANTITGTVYEDLDIDGVKDAGEPGIQNVTIYLYLDKNSNGQVDPEDTRIQSTITDINGNYTFFYATTGTLLATTEFISYPSGYTLTTDNVEIIVFSDNVNFGESDSNNNFGLATGIDCDGDGLSDIQEGIGDADGDGVPNECDLDSDNDGILDSVEGPSDFDGDGIPNYLDRDSDDDGIPDAIEANRGIVPAEYVSSQGNMSGTDSDGNGIIDSRETFAGSGIMVAANPDSDNDGKKDYLDLDSDNDGILDLREAGGTSDIDGDGQFDNITDVNNNGYADALESSPLAIPNTDSAYEIANGLPLKPNYIDIDSDADGIDDTREGYSTTGYRFPQIIVDVDQDGIIDFWDVSNGESPIIPFDRDSDGIPDYIDINSDNDTESDFIEGNDADFNGVADVANSGLDANGNGLDDAFDSGCVTGTTTSFIAAQWAEQNNSSGAVDISVSSDIEMVNDGGTNQTVGFRFTNVSIAQGATIGNAYVQFQADETSTGTVNITIKGQLSTNAPVFTTTNSSISGRTKTVASKTWSPATWTTVGDAGAAQRTVDVAPIIQEIVNQGGWASGNSIVLIFTGPSGTRTAEVNPSLSIQVATGPSSVCSSNVSLPDEDSNGEYDFRETASLDSDFDGIPDVDDIDDDNDGILDVNEGCADVTVATGNATAASQVLAQVQNPELAIDGANGTVALLKSDGATMGVTLRGGAIVPNGVNITIRSRKRDASALDRMIVSESVNGVDFVNPVTYSFAAKDAYENKIYTLTTNATHIRVVSLRDRKDIEVDNISYAGFTANICKDSDGDGIVDRLDLDSDNDGIPDIIEAGGVDLDNNGRVDNFVDTDGDGWANTFDSDNGGTALPDRDSDNDGVRNYLDLDSDNDGIPDIIEAGGVDSDKNGRVDNFVDTDKDGWANTFDKDNGGNALADNDTDGDGFKNRIDIDSDGDGIVDLIESQATTGTPRIPSGTDTDGDGLDNNFDSDNGGTTTTPVDTDGDTTPDYLDTNSDNDSFPDALEGWDTDNDRIANTVPSGLDTDGDGLDNAYDLIVGPNKTTNVYNNQNALNFPKVSTAGMGTDRDWRQVNLTDTDRDGIPDVNDIDDDNDGILDVNEGCTDTPVAGANASAASQIVARVEDPANGINGVNATFARFRDDGAQMQVVLRSGNIIRAGTVLTVRALKTDGNALNRMTVSESTNGTTYVNSQTYTFTTANIYENKGYALTTNATHIRITFLRNAGDLRVDNVSYPGFNAPCVGIDTDNDGIPNHLDLDSDNDGIFDIIEAGGVDTNKDGRVDVFVDTNNNGWANVFDPANGGTILPDPDTDGDGKKNRIDIDSDGDGIVDLIESQVTSGSPRRPLGNDTDGDGIDNVFDLDSGGTPTVPVNTDGTDNPDYLDLDSDNDGLNDIIEGWDSNGDFLPEKTPSGTDSDNDGLDDAFDNLSGLKRTLNVSNSQTANSFPDITTANKTTQRDWRESNLTNCEPGGVNSGLLLWLKANDGGIYWRDISNNYVSLSTSGSPAVGSLINFNPSNAFDGNDYYGTNLSINAGTRPDLAVIAVYQPSQNNSGAVWGEQNGGFDRYILDGPGGTENDAVSNGTSNQNNITGLFPTGTTTLSTVIFDEDEASGSSVKINGKNEVNFFSNHAPGTSNNFQIGALGDGTRRFNGNIAEIIVYNQLLTPASTLRQIESYLAIKYGVTLSNNTDGDANVLEAGEGDYVASNGTVFWDADEVSGFQNNVAGIGRDDATCLNQLQSKSVNPDAIVTIGLDANNNGLEASNALNQSSFGTNLSALVWGHDGEALYDRDENIDFDRTQVKSRLNREWRVQETGTVGTVTVRFNVSSLLGPNGVGTNDESKIVMLVDADGDFSSGANVVNQSFVVDSDGFVNFQVDFADGNYYTLGSSEYRALPITLISFQGQPKKDHVELKWITAGEIDNSLFRVDRSADGKTFESIGYLEGSGTSELSNNYMLRDNSPFNGRNYYRLVDIDNNGVEHFSEIIKVNYFKEISFDLKPYPNPIKNGETFYLNLDHEIVLDGVKLYRMDGIEVPIKTERTAGKLAISPNQVSQGVHLLTIMANGKLLKFKIVVTG